MLDPHLSPGALLYRLFNENGVWVSDEKEISSKCRCSRDNFLNSQATKAFTSKFSTIISELQLGTEQGYQNLLDDNNEAMIEMNNLISDYVIELQARKELEEQIAEKINKQTSELQKQEDTANQLREIFKESFSNMNYEDFINSSKLIHDENLQSHT